MRLLQLPPPEALRPAEADLAWVIVPCSRPQNLERVLANFTRQKFPFKKLVVVLNGEARSLTPMQQLRLDNHQALVLTSDHHQSAAKNTALYEIKKRGGGFTVVMDDDDWYGPQYLTEAVGYARTYDIIGKRRHFVHVLGDLWLCTRELRLQEGGWLTGGTIACWAENCPDYSVKHDFGEDAAFCQAAVARGMTIFSTDVYQYLYYRGWSQAHTWKMSPQQLRHYESARSALDLGPCDLSLVTGEKLSVLGQRLSPHDERVTLAPPDTGSEAHVV